MILNIDLDNYSLQKMILNMENTMLTVPIITVHESAGDIHIVQASTHCQAFLIHFSYVSRLVELF